jgi:diaminohydroxyphosphoribosylaminopyrimidine deaminase/5-amino-6-(5-phosphoribosylamino)uracil reductase
MHAVFPMKEKDIQFMTLALELAEKGRGRTSPNPCVGAVIVRQDTIIGRGYHKKAGTPHAEIHAIADAGGCTPGSTLYVTLEPCNHTGRTPPCTHAILEAGITRVVVGMLDPNPAVRGGGCRFLESKGVVVERGVLEKKCRSINRPFIKHVATGMPWVTMKAGMSLDGKISYCPGRGGRITGEQSREVTHALRNTLDAILVGVDTAIIDNPSLTTRLQGTGTRGRDPVRVVLDTQLRLPPDSRMLHQESSAPTWIFCGSQAPEENEQRLRDSGAYVKRLACGDRGMPDLQEVLSEISRTDMISVLVEGGSKIHGSLLRSNLVDEAYLFVAPFFIGSGGTALLDGFSCSDAENRLSMKQVEVRLLGEDILIHALFPHTD